jgi:ABC-type multidrug transport system fused ATPase/permease subunit
MAALLYSGPQSVLTGQAAIRGLGISWVEPKVIDVLIPAAQKRQAMGFVSIRRPVRLPELWVAEGERRYALAARAVGDAARVAGNLAEARAIVAGAVQKRRCSVNLLIAELAAGPRNGSRLFRIALGEVADGVLSVAEADFRELILRAGLPRPLFNEPVRRADGSVIAVVDALWAEARVAGEVDSREWHLSPADWEHTMRRHNELARCGIQLLHFSPRQIKTEPRAVVAAIAGAGPARKPGRCERPAWRVVPRLPSVSTDPAVDIVGLAKSYRRTTAVAGLTLRAERAQVTAILGPNGAGKTTTVEICKGYRRADAGQVQVLGLDPARTPRCRGWA